MSNEMKEWYHKADSKHKNIGSNFDDFLREEGLLEEVEKAVAERKPLSQKEVYAMVAIFILLGIVIGTCAAYLLGFITI